ADRVTVVNAALAATSGRVPFTEAGPYGFVAGGAAPAGPTVDVPASRVADLVEELRAGPVAAVKLDVEGSEAPATVVMRRLLSPSAPVVVYESNGHTLHWFGWEPGHVIAALAALGYASYAIQPDGLRPVAPVTLQWNCVVDYLATKTPPQNLASFPL